MKKIYYLKPLILIAFFSTMHGQEIDTISTETLATYLNKEIATKVQFKAKKDHILLSLAGKNFDLDLSRKTPDSVFNRPSRMKNGRYIGPIFWHFNFPEITQTKSVFELDTLSQLQLRLQINLPDTILIGSRLNAFSSHHHIYNSRPHKVAWTGEKSLLITIKTVRKDRQLHCSMLQIKLDGNFNRMDRFKLSPRYVIALEQRFMEALNKFFQEQKNPVLFSINDPL